MITRKLFNSFRVKSSPGDGSLAGFGFDSATNTTEFAGEKVTAKNAMELSTVYSCIRDKSESIGQLPNRLIRRHRNDPSKVELVIDPSYRAYQIFVDRPNSYMTMQEFKEMAVANLEAIGYFGAYVDMGSKGVIREIIPFYNQRSLTLNLDQQTGDPFVSYTTNDGRIINTWLSDPKLIYVKLFTFDGFRPASPIAYGAKTLGVAISMQSYQGSVLSEGSLGRGYLSTEEYFKDESKLQALKEDWKANFGGSKNAGSTPILEQGLKFNSFKISPADQELLNQMKLSREQQCSLFKVPPSRVGVSEVMKYKNVEDANIAYMRDSLNPTSKKLDEAFTRVLQYSLRKQTRSDSYDWVYYIQSDVREFIRGDLKTQTETALSKFDSGAATLNQTLLSLGDLPVENGDVYKLNVNNQRIGTLEELIAYSQEVDQTTSDSDNGANDSEENDDES